MDKFMKKIVWLFIIAPAIYLAIVWNTLPETIAMHFNLKGDIDRYGSKNELTTMILILIAVNAGRLFIITPGLQDRSQKIRCRK
jgi:uncharacterized membrane protein